MTTLGCKYSAESKARISAALKGREPKPEVQAAAKAANTGRKLSAETKAKMSASHRGRMTPEHKAKLRAVNSSRVRSPEERAKLAAANKGERSHFWKGGIAVENHGLRKIVAQLLAYKTWRAAVFAKDSSICQGAGPHKGALDAHHIKHFQVIINQYEITTVEQALACKELWDANNGKTLCKNCHKQIHGEERCI